MSAVEPFTKVVTNAVLLAVPVSPWNQTRSLAVTALFARQHSKSGSKQDQYKVWGRIGGVKQGNKRQPEGWIASHLDKYEIDVKYLLHNVAASMDNSLYTGPLTLQTALPAQSPRVPHVFTLL
jgi:hypothetical protein